MRQRNILIGKLPFDCDKNNFYEYKKDILGFQIKLLPAKNGMILFDSSDVLDKHTWNIWPQNVPFYNLKRVLQAQDYRITGITDSLDKIREISAFELPTIIDKESYLKSMILLSDDITDITCYDNVTHYADVIKQAKILIDYYDNNKNTLMAHFKELAIRYIYFKFIDCNMPMMFYNKNLKVFNYKNLKYLL